MALLAACLPHVASAQIAFTGVRLSADAVQTEAVFVARRANAWTDGSGTRRLSLDEDVRLRLAGYDLTADRAAVWIADRDDLAASSEGGRFVQLFVYAEGVDTPLAEPAVAVTAEDLRIQGVLLLERPLSVSADAVASSPSASAFDDRAQRAFDEAMATAEPVVPLMEAPTTESAGPVPARGPDDRAVASASTEGARAAPATARTDHRAEGYVTIAAERLTRVVDDEGGDSIILSGGMHAAYSIPGEDRVLELSGQRAVVFLNERGEGSASLGSVRASAIDGIYLEGDVVATDAGYALRGPRMYYDVRQDKALILDAVFRTSDESRGSPLYMRAASVRQVSRNEFVADRARLSNTAFARPNITLGTRTVTLTREPRPGASSEAEVRTMVDARGITLNAGTVPIAWLPRFRGDPERIPLRQISFVNVTDAGAEVRTEWDALTLFGFESRDDVDITLLADAMFKRGPGLGFEASWDTRGREGGLLTYWVIEDSGTDVLSTSARIERDGETRGIVRGEDRKTIDDLWTQRTEIAHVTDPAFVDSFYEPFAETGREFQTRLHLTRTEDHTLFTLEVAGQLDDFTPNEYLLQSQGYSVERLPEATYTRLADDVLPGLPGRLTYTSQSRVGLLRFENYDATPRDFGFTSNARAQRAFGINADETFDSSLAAQGQTEDYRFRFDTRHELTADLDAGPVQITPWVTGRLTAYDNDFAEFGPGTGDEARVHFVSGVTASTTVQRVLDGVYSRVLDVNRLRHLMTPSVTVFNAVTSVDQDELPVYDESVESLANGTALRLAVEQTIQTKRGGPGRWYNADLLTLDAEMVFATDDAIGESSIGRFDPAQPELSRLSDFSSVNATYQLSDSIALVGGTIYDLDRERSQQTTAGLLVDHHSGLSSFVRYRRLQDQNSTLLSTGFRYGLTEKYDLNSSITFDTQASSLQTVNAEILRAFQSAVFGAAVTYNNIQESTSIGVIFQPLGQGSATRIGGQDNPADNRGSPLGG